MKVVIDTNVMISGVFFGGAPRMVLNAIIDEKITACATLEIVEEYQEIVEEMIARKQGHLNQTPAAHTKELPVSLFAKHPHSCLSSKMAV